MELEALLTDDRAVSPVIGVVLMVGITVALAAVVATFVLGVSVTSSAPDASFRYEGVPAGSDWGDAATGDEFHIHHDGGEDVDLDHVVIEYAGTPVGSVPWMSPNAPSGSYWKPGETFVLEDTGTGGDFASGQQVLVLWRSEDGSSSQILANGDLP